MSAISIFWHRRDLRFYDNAGLYHALRADTPVLPLFIFDRNILDKLDDVKDARVEFIYQQVEQLQAAQQERGSDMLVEYGFPLEVWKKLLQQFTIKAVYTNRDYETYAKKRDQEVKNLLAAHNIPLKTFKDHVIFEADEVQKKVGGTYTVFTPYKNTWLKKLDSRTPDFTTTGVGEDESFYLTSYPTEKYFANFLKVKQRSSVPTLEEMGFSYTQTTFPSKEVDRELIENYDKNRDYPAVDGTSRLSIHFRFGTISIRQKARRARRLNATFLKELIWRDFYAQILDQFPHVERNCFRPKYEAIAWINDEAQFEAWCEGKTGYPIVDAGIRQLNQSGYMHNRVRMIVASFLTKHLLIDWRWGEAYFAAKLQDYELASNNGGWQWAGGCGTDAQPYFRVFNPSSQLDKFDKNRVYVKRWVPEYGTDAYPAPIVEHKMARDRAIEVYKTSLARAEAEGI